jgi:hypothetical protein
MSTTTELIRRSRDAPFAERDPASAARPDPVDPRAVAADDDENEALLVLVVLDARVQARDALKRAEVDVHLRGRVGGGGRASRAAAANGDIERLEIIGEVGEDERVVGADLLRVSEVLASVRCGEDVHGGWRVPGEGLKRSDSRRGRTKSESKAKRRPQPRRHFPLTSRLHSERPTHVPIYGTMSNVEEYLPEAAQKEVKTLADEDADSTNSNIRYMAYGSRLQTALRAGSRYIAYVRVPQTS